MSYYSDEINEVISQLNTDIETGLSDDEFIEKQKEFGLNKLREKPKKTNWQRFIDQFKDPMILILIAAAVISFIVACFEGELKEFFEPLLIMAIVIMNAFMGMFQESKAEKALDALKSLSAPHARVIRNGVEQVIDAVNLVPGDIIKLEAGDFVPADARLIKSSSLKSEESALTGESVPSEKNANAVVKDNAGIGDRTNMVFSGCSISYGSATAVVTHTGMDTEMGRIANLLDSETDTQTPLQQKLSKLGQYLGTIAIIACVIVFIVGVYNGLPVMEIFITAVSLAVSAIPEGLPAIVTIILSIGVQRLVKQNAIIRRLPAVETLGSASIICSDKTGTLTQNRMTLVKAYADGQNDTEDISDNNSEEIKKILKYATLCSDGYVVVENGEEKHIGDPTETSIILATLKNGFTKEALFEQYPRLLELPFDSDRKLMTTINNIDGKNIVIVKGAFDVIEKIAIKGDLDKAREYNDSMSAQALRIIAVAYKEIDTIPENPSPENIENNLTFLGLVGMIDPPRPEAAEAVKLCRTAGIKPVMITGDHVITAKAIAKDLGIYVDDDISITGPELDNMTDTELDNNIEKISVYARVSPENKIRIVKSWQRKDKVVAMTGDGVNDAPALKAADIGCAMGITGTDVAKSAADMTLTDDNFATIIHAVREGRGIYANIKKVVGYLLGTNIGEVLTVFTAMMLWHVTPLLSMHLLWINLVTDGLPAIALGMEPVEPNIMEQKPKPKNEDIFANGFGIITLLQGFMFAILTLIAFKIGEAATNSLQGGQTMAFIVLALSQVVQSFNMRSSSSLFKIGFFTNKNLNIAASISIVLVLLVLFTPLHIPFGLVKLSTSLYLIGFGLSIVPFVIIEFTKFVGLIKHHH
ncbi:MAG: cation-translocating P-type ATPase [Christensenellaceae bacterium]|nr:cation-translocating P-type ATPase [Christensenellaceae bacterium]